ncbi:MAG: M1 family metallopeptidase, partial [Tissierellia bacterium]|nr:M1 family metallopeptidase [Tissierellia bacterium]
MLRKRSLSILLVLTIILGSFQLGFAVDLDNLTEYNMNLKLDTENHILYGEQMVEIINSYNSDLKEIVFHLYPDAYLSYETKPAIGGFYFMDGEEPKLEEEQKGYIEIEAVHIDNNESKYTKENQILKVPLEKPLKNGEKINVKVAFKLKIPTGSDRFHHMNE